MTICGLQFLNTTYLDIPLIWHTAVYILYSNYWCLDWLLYFAVCMSFLLFMCEKKKKKAYITFIHPTNILVRNRNQNSIRVLMCLNNPCIEWGGLCVDSSWLRIFSSVYIIKFILRNELPFMGFSKHWKWPGKCTVRRQRVYSKVRLLSKNGFLI